MAAKKKIQLKVTQVRSIIGRTGKQKKTMQALGFRRMHQAVTHTETPQIRGMLSKVNHLVKIEQV